MMNIGEQVILSSRGLVTSLAWRRGGKTEYVLEGNLNYAGAVISWLQKELGLIQSPEETEQLARHAAKDDSLYLIPAFSGLGAPLLEFPCESGFYGNGQNNRKSRACPRCAGMYCISGPGRNRRYGRGCEAASERSEDRRRTYEKFLSDAVPE